MSPVVEIKKLLSLQLNIKYHARVQKFFSNISIIALGLLFSDFSYQTSTP